MACATCNTTKTNKVVDLSEDTNAVELVNYLARLSYESEANKQVIAELIERHKDDEDFIDSALFKKYHKRYEESFAAYKLAQDEFSKTIVPKYSEKVNATWNLEFNDYRLTLS